MSAVKDRKVFSIKNFRGLDKENKAVKVSIPRASDGLNFMLDSDTLKTRPAFRFKEELPFVLGENEIVIAWHDFKNVRLYVTNYHIYVKDGASVFNEDDNPYSGGMPLWIKNTFLPFDFSGRTPIFREEKDCLFLFGLGYIFVFALIFDGIFVSRYVLYDIKTKPENPFSSTDGRFLSFEELPKPYEPTIYLGDRGFEDVNLLSRVTKYRLFAGTGNAIDGKKIYILPTHYVKEKHGSFTPTIEFYKNRYKGLDKFPVFMGVLGENFTDVSDFGATPIGFEPITLEGTFYPKRDFEYFGASTDVTPTRIVEDYGIDRTVFFNMRLSTDQTVFDYLINYITTQTVSNNTVLYFTVKTKCRSIFRNISNNYVNEIVVVDKNINVYVQIKKYDELTFAFVDQELKSSVVLNEEDTGVPYPNYPTITITPDQTIDLGTILRQNYTSNDFKNLALSYLIDNKDDFDDAELVYIKGRMYYIDTKSVDRNAEIGISSSWHIGDIDNDLVWDDFSTVTPYPSFSNPSALPVIEYGQLISQTGWTFNYTKGSALYNQIRNAIVDLVGSSGDLVLSSGNAFAKIKVQTSFDLPEGTGYRGQCLVVPFAYLKSGTYDFQVRQSFSFTGKVSKSTQTIVENLYRFELSDDSAFFKFTLNDYFYDYNNEPSIDISVSFQNNPNYDYIANCKFGTVFGSENRLFLAGNPEFPNIDRFNVSNDLLGNNVKSQSYELSYFPSKNYRVLGGRGAINGYIVATDNQLYVTKETYPNDNVLFVRIRNVNENGSVWYNEFKTSVGESPINPRCLARFYNDVVILSRNGLFAIELSSNVLTDERLLKLRSGFINKDLVRELSLVGKEVPFIVENNYNMYIIVGNKAFVCDSRYISHNPNSVIENYSYEIVKWALPLPLRFGKVSDGDPMFVVEGNEMIYHFEFNDKDMLATFHEAALFVQYFSYLYGDEEVPETVSLSQIYFQLPSSFDGLLANPEKLSFIVPDQTGTTALYIALTFLIPNDGGIGFILSTVKKEDVPHLVKNQNESVPNFYTRVYANVVDSIEFAALFALQDCTIFTEQIIDVTWLSAITDMGNDLMEKTMFRVNFYATRMNAVNNLYFGYKTMRRLRGLNENEAIAVNKQIDLANTFDFGDIDLNTFTINTFNEFAVSVPAKENNFLYIQFLVAAQGQVELNAIEIIYKLNRLLKTIG